MDFFKDPASLITAIGALIASVATLLKSIADLRSKDKASPVTKPSSAIQLIKSPFFLLGIVLAAAGIGIFVIRAIQVPSPLNVRLTSEAWVAFNSHNYESATLKAQECINQFKSQAIKNQEELTASNTPLPSFGFVSEEAKQLIFSRGVLNDVGTCYFISGQSLEKLNRMDEAKNSYTEAQKFTYARTWDDSSGFWSPAEAAKVRFDQLP